MTEEEKRQEEQKREDERRRQDEERRRREQQAIEERARQEEQRRREQSQGKPQDGRSEEISEGTARTLSGGSRHTESEEQTIQTARERGVPIAPVAGLKRESGAREAESPVLQGEKPEQGQTPAQKPAQGKDSPAVERLKSKMDGMQDKIQSHIKAQGQTHEQGHDR